MTWFAVMALLPVIIWLRSSSFPSQILKTLPLYLWCFTRQSHTFEDVAAARLSKAHNISFLLLHILRHESISPYQVCDLVYKPVGGNWPGVISPTHWHFMIKRDFVTTIPFILHNFKLFHLCSELRPKSNWVKSLHIWEHHTILFILGIHPTECAILMTASPTVWASFQFIVEFENDLHMVSSVWVCPTPRNSLWLDIILKTVILLLFQTE